MSAKQTDEEKSKDLYFQKVAALSQEMIDAHGKDFSMGTLVLAARFIAEGKMPGQASARPEQH